jgi:hypothetical protein
LSFEALVSAFFGNGGLFSREGDDRCDGGIVNGLAEDFCSDKQVEPARISFMVEIPLFLEEGKTAVMRK